MVVLELKIDFSKKKMRGKFKFWVKLNVFGISKMTKTEHFQILEKFKFRVNTHVLQFLKLRFQKFWISNFHQNLPESHRILQNATESFGNLQNHPEPSRVLQNSSESFWAFRRIGGPSLLGFQAPQIQILGGKVDFRKKQRIRKSSTDLPHEVKPDYHQSSQHTRQQQQHNNRRSFRKVCVCGNQDDKNTDTRRRRKHHRFEFPATKKNQS